MPQQRRAGRRAELASDLAGIPGDTAQQPLRRRGGHGQNAVGALHRAAACADGRGEDALRRELIDKQAHAQHVGHGVDAADLVEVDVFHLRAVHLRLGACQQIKDRDRVGAHPVRYRRRGKKAAQLADRGVGVTMAQLLALFIARNVDLHVQAAYAAAHHVLRRDDGETAERAVELIQYGISVGNETEQRRGEHVAGRAHAAVEIKRFHKLLLLSFASSSTRVKYGASASRIASHFSCAAAV